MELGKVRSIILGCFQSLRNNVYIYLRNSAGFPKYSLPGAPRIVNHHSLLSNVVRTSHPLNTASFPSQQQPLASISQTDIRSRSFYFLSMPKTHLFYPSTCALISEYAALKRHFANCAGGIYGVFGVRSGWTVVWIEEREEGRFNSAMIRMNCLGFRNWDYYFSKKAFACAIEGLELVRGWEKGWIELSAWSRD